MAVLASSAANLLAQLEEKDDALKLDALQNLNKVVHEFWFQIANSISSVEAFYEDETFSHRELAALVASKVFYYLGELDDALSYALGAGQLFDLKEGSEYVQTLVARCLDKYIEASTKDEDDPPLDPRLEAIVQRMFERCYQDEKFEHAIGIALDARRLDKIEETIDMCTDKVSIIKYAFQVSQSLDINLSKSFRQSAIKLLVNIYKKIDNPDWVAICHCLSFLNDSDEVADIIANLMKGNKRDSLLAYQICFNLFDNEMQAFLIRVDERLLDLLGLAAASKPETRELTDGREAAEPTEDESQPMLEATPSNNNETAIETTTTKVVSELQQRYDRVSNILRGNIPIQLHLEFLHRKNNSDLQILNNLKVGVEIRNGICHSAIVFANAMMHAGTTSDSFLRENLDWLSRASNWSKFSATAGLGVIHKGHLSQGRALMSPYLPHDDCGLGSYYSEGGALYALGLIHVDYGSSVRQYLFDSMRNATNGTIQHGACLGLGLAALGTNDEEILEGIKSVLYMDNAIVGEAAGIAMGLVSAGSGNSNCAELLAYAHDTQHEKIIRGISLGLALTVFECEEAADTLIEQMTTDQDPILRYGGAQTIGMAYVGTGNNNAIQRLLHIAVSDVSDDVRRAAVMNLGFVLIGFGDRCPNLVSLLAKSYNQHVRYGAALAIGISCASTGLEVAVKLLRTLLDDPCDLVRQGADIALAMVLMQQPETKSVTKFRKQLMLKARDKHEDSMCRMGAIMASALTLQPTALLALDENLDLPELEVVCHCPKSKFAYPSPVTLEIALQVSRVPKAILSTTRYAAAKERRREEAKTLTLQRVSTAGKKDAESRQTSAKKRGKERRSERGASVDYNDDVKSPRKDDQPLHNVENSSRVVPQQVGLLSFPPDSKWKPVTTNIPLTGFIVLEDTKPDEPPRKAIVDEGEPNSQSLMDVDVNDSNS